ncbi:hypothetical protein ABEB36_004553 [Hypothenemus hampei]|uniref:Ras-GEF domain-containing protein n=1 Tax=Hypothenemus hampei TaxID=57062 RepID=A0ABD1F3Q5_HYPHA
METSFFIQKCEQYRFSGLTPSKLILAADILPPIQFENVTFNPYVDPELETFELIAIYPVQCVNLSIYRRKRRQALKARFCNNRVLYFELGGFERRNMFWNLWCEKVKFLCPGDSEMSCSETSVATSSTTDSSLYLVERKMVTTLNGIKQLWCKFGPNFAIDTHFINQVVNTKNLGNKWTDRHLYLGKDFQENILDYKPIVELPRLPDKSKKKKARSKPKLNYPCLTQEKHLTFGDSVQVNRFGSGVLEGCGTGLYLTVDDYITPTGNSTSLIKSTSSEPSLKGEYTSTITDYELLAETAVLIWELYGYSQFNMKYRHRRRYGFSPKPLFLYGLGPWNVNKGDKMSLQLKRAVSDVNLQNLNTEKQLKLPVSRRQLYATVSCSILIDNDYPASRRSNNSIINAPKKPVVVFWTPGYWYRPISAKDAYNQLQNHLKKIQACHESKPDTKNSLFCLGRRCRKHHFMIKLKKKRNKKFKEDSDEDDFLFQKKLKTRKRYSLISSVLKSKIEESLHLWDDGNDSDETPLQRLKRLLKIDVATTAWDFNSTTLAQQLTIIDKDLFLKISISELENLLWQQSAKNAPNIAAMIAFSYRISCLIASEILRQDMEKARARLIARFVNVANKCHRMSNFHSCRSVLGGLQNPAIFRLRKTWAYVRKKHSTKYQLFEFLSRLYRDPRMPSFQKTFFLLSQNPPFMPFIGHIISKLLDKIPAYKIQTLERQFSFCTTKSYKSNTSLQTTPQNPINQQFHNLFSKLFKVFANNAISHTTTDEKSNYRKEKLKNKSVKLGSKSVKFKGLYEYFEPFDQYSDNRPERLLETIDLLERSQLGAMHYNYDCNDIARSFLLKARYFDDQDNFFNSIKLEQ